MQVTLAYAERQLRHWTKKVNELRLTRQTRLTSNTKENENEKENLPPTPPIREKEKEKERSSSTSRAREESDSEFKPPAVVDIHTPPSLPLLRWWAKTRGGITDDKFVTDWFDMMTNKLYWCHPQTGNPLSHWPAYFLKCYKNYKHEMKADDDAHRIKCTVRASNWRGTRKEDIQHVF